MVKKIYIKKILTDNQLKDLEGTWVTDKHIKLGIVKHDSDIILKENGKDIIVAKFRKKILNTNLCDLGWDSYKKAALPSRGRGASAGPIDLKGTYWKKRNPVKTSKWSTNYMNGSKVSKMRVNNQVASNVLGYYEGTPFLNLPPRMTNSTRTHFKKFQEGLAFIRKLSDEYKKLVPSVYNKQLKKASKRDYLRIPGTAFSSITVNRNFRTALHTDSGNFNGGMAVMTVLERGKYSGGYTVFPQYGIGFDVRHGDVLVMENCNTWHANTEITETKEQEKYNNSIEDIFKDNVDVGTVGLGKKYTRLTFVCYLRDKLSDSSLKHKNNKYILKYDKNILNRTEKNKKKSKITLKKWKKTKKK
jgi:hypothetical protein